MKVLLILIDGMRPDSLTDAVYAQKWIKKSSYAPDAQTVFPSVTLPCHMSLFHSVNPERHGITTNTYTPQVRPVDGLCEVLKKNNKRCAFFYNWEELKDLSRPDSMTFAYFCSGHTFGYETANRVVTDAAVKHLSEYDIDFAFLYLGWSDMAGHTYGWMSDEYIEAVQKSWYEADRIISSLSDEYTVIVTADHGGHDRMHGSDCPSDMTIPIMFYGQPFKAGKRLENVNIKDIAPTIVRLFDIEPDREWEGKSLI